MEKLSLRGCLMLLLVSRILLSSAAGQTLEEQENFLNDKEKKVRLLAHHALFLQLAADTTDCGLSNCVDKCSRHSCLPMQEDHFTCIKAPRNVTDCTIAGTGGDSCMNLKVDFIGNGFVRVPPQFQNFSNLSPELTRAICSQSILQFPASSEPASNELTFWNYFGSAEGAWRIYPGREADPNKGCIQYDPRKRPWYITAVSVIKDLVVLLDTGQVDSSTFVNTKTVIQELFGTFRPDDRINLVTFNSTRAILQQQNSVIVKKDQPSSLLYRTFQVLSLSNTPQGFSNITKAFETARGALNSTSLLKMIMVLTDGNFAKRPGFNNDAALLQMAASLNSDHVTVFFFSLGVNMTPDPLIELRSLSCKMNSTVTYVTQVDAQRNPLWAIRPYFDYQATLRTTANSSFWTEAYDDFDGLGLVATVTYPVFSDGILYGVAGIDVVVKSNEISNSIKRRLFDANVRPNRLACQETQVNLTKCTKAVEPHDQAICPQSMFLNEPPTEAYLKNLCCDNCAIEEFSKRDFKTKLLAVILPGFLVLTIVIFACYLLGRKVVKPSVSETTEDFVRQPIATHRYSYKDLKSCTQKFHKDKKLGEGGFGEVYQGRLKDGTLVAVKKLSKNSKQGAHEFLNEVVVISGVKHRNLVKLQGYCVEGRHRLLVYEYMENRSLRQTLLGDPKETIPVNWFARFSIALGTAQGLLYLHYEITPRIIHRDIKASNVLLDHNLEAKIADFGIAKLFPEEKSHFTTKVAGTLGYAAPEYVTRGQLTEKVDVYGYGIVLMEIVTGEVNMKRTPSGSLLFLVDKVRCMYKLARIADDEQILVSLVDSRLEGSFDSDQVLRVLKTALLCTLDNPELRIPTSKIIPILLGSESITEDDLLPLVKLEYSKSLHTANFGVDDDW